MKALLDGSLALVEAAFLRYTESLIVRRMAATAGADGDALFYLDEMVNQARSAYEQARGEFLIVAQPLADHRNEWADIKLDIDALLLSQRQTRLRALAGDLIPAGPCCTNLSDQRERLLARLLPGTTDTSEGGETDDCCDQTRTA
jgi:hypothetical protein